MSTVDRSSKFAESTSEVTSLENEPSAVQPDRTQDSSPPARNRPFGGRWGKTVEERSALAHVRRAASAERYALYRQNAETLRAWALQQPGVAGHAAKLILVDQLCTAYVAQLCVQYRVTRMGPSASWRDWHEWTRRANEVLKRLVALGWAGPGVPGRRK